MYVIAIDREDTFMAPYRHLSLDDELLVRRCDVRPGRGQRRRL